MLTHRSDHPDARKLDLIVAELRSAGELHVALREKRRRHTTPSVQHDLQRDTRRLPRIDLNDDDAIEVDPFDEGGSGSLQYPYAFRLSIAREESAVVDDGARHQY